MGDVCYYTDEHVARAVIRGLRQRGVDVLTALEVNKLGAEDDEHLVFALAEGRVVFTQDEDFLRLASAGNAHAGIVYAPQHTPIGELINGLMLIYRVLRSEEMAGNIEYL